MNACVRACLLSTNSSGSRKASRSRLAVETVAVVEGLVEVD